jgi:hypothetical protein
VSREKEPRFALFALACLSAFLCLEQALEFYQLPRIRYADPMD